MICSARDQEWIYWVASLTHFSFFSILSEPKFTRVSAWLTERRPSPPPVPGVDPDLSLSKHGDSIFLAKYWSTNGQVPKSGQWDMRRSLLGASKKCLLTSKETLEEVVSFLPWEISMSCFETWNCYCHLINNMGMESTKRQAELKKKIMEKSSLGPGKLDLETPF